MVKSLNTCSPQRPTALSYLALHPTKTQDLPLLPARAWMRADGGVSLAGACAWLPSLQRLSRLSLLHHKLGAQDVQHVCACTGLQVRGGSVPGCLCLPWSTVPGAIRV